MKKSVKAILAGALLSTVLIAGCSTIPTMSNEKSGIIYNGGGVVSVGDHLIYANGHVSGVDGFSASSDSEYKAGQAYGYLSRTDMSKFEGSKDSNENEVNKLSGKLAGYSNTYMFAVGNSVYFATPNLHKTSGNKYIWNYVSIFKCSINGGNEKEVYTTTAYDVSKAQIKALEFNEKNYLVIFDGENLVKIDLSNDKASVIAEGVTSVALPDEGEKWDGNIYYTTARESDVGQQGNIVYKAGIEKALKTVIADRTDLTFTFTGRVENELFYTREVVASGIKETYSHSTENQQKSFDTAGKRFYPLEVSNVDAIAEGNTEYNGYTFTVTVSEKMEVRYYNSYKAASQEGYQAELLIAGSQGYADTVVTFGTEYYYTTSEGIFKTDVSSKTSEQIVSDMTIKTGVYGYDYVYVDGNISRLNNIYFYSQIPESEETEKAEEEGESDTNYYLFGVDKNGQKDPVLVGKKA